MSRRSSDFVAQGKRGAGVAGLGVVELGAERGEGAGAVGRGERVEPHLQGPVVGGDVAAGGEGFADEGAGLVAGAGVVPVQGAGQDGLGVAGGRPDGVGDQLDLGLQPSVTFSIPSAASARLAAALMTDWSKETHP
jgi:hypothetical protein